MNVAIQIPDDVSESLRERWGDVARHALEAVALEGYRSGALTASQVGRLLGHTSRWETEAFLKRMGAWLHYTEADLDKDLAVLRESRGS
jgi:hypothetical protein